MAQGMTIEAFQAPPTQIAPAATPPTPLRMEMLEISQQQNAEASNYMAFYGFMNLLAVGLLFYIARAQ